MNTLTDNKVVRFELLAILVTVVIGVGSAVISDNEMAERDKHFKETMLQRQSEQAQQNHQFNQHLILKIQELSKP